MQTQIVTHLSFSLPSYLDSSLMPALTDCCASFRHFGRAKMTYDTVKHQFKTLFYVEMDIFRNGHFLAQT